MYIFFIFFIFFLASEQAGFGLRLRQTILVFGIQENKH